MCVSHLGKLVRLTFETIAVRHTIVDTAGFCPVRVLLCHEQYTCQSNDFNMFIVYNNLSLYTLIAYSERSPIRPHLALNTTEHSTTAVNLFTS